MKKAFKVTAQILTGVGAALILWTGKAMALDADSSVSRGAEAARADGMPSELLGDNGVFRQVTNTILLIVGIISVVMLVYDRLRYIISGGDSKKVTDAKNTILYAIIGLIIAILAYAIIGFVLNTLGVPTVEQMEEQMQQQNSQPQQTTPTAQP